MIEKPGQKIPQEDLDLINKNLADYYGYMDGKAKFRVIWSEDELEKRLTHYTKEGLRLLTPEVREFPKYRQWIQERYILERLTAIIEFGDSKKTGLIEKLGYEPIWTFETKSGNYLPPTWPACKYLLMNLLENVRTAGLTKYKDPDSDPEEALENKIKRISEIETELFGNETVVGDALAYKEGVTVPSNYERSK